MVHTESGVEITEGLRNNVELLRLNCATLNTCLRDCFVFLSPGVVFILLALWNPFCMNRTVHMTPFNLERICNQLLRAKIWLGLILSFSAIKMIVIKLNKQSFLRRLGVMSSPAVEVSGHLRFRPLQFSKRVYLQYGNTSRATTFCTKWSIFVFSITRHRQSYYVMKMMHSGTTISRASKGNKNWLKNRGVRKITLK